MNPTQNKPVPSTSRRIAVNTLSLYFRMLFLLVVSLYVNRVVLAELGAEDFGIYNVVGGIVPILLFITTALANATQRFFNVEIGKGGDLTSLRKVFATTCFINLVLTVIVVLLSETLGLWFVNHCMNFRPERMTSVNWVYQFSVINCIPGILFASYFSSIICHEHMKIFAGLSVFEAVIKLAFVFALPYIPSMKLEFFTLMVFAVGCFQQLFYILYSRRHFAECRQLNFRLVDRESLRGVLGFTSWTVLGVLDTIVHTQGIGILVNIFYGTVVNAAYGIANQMNTVVKRFIQSFMTAFMPHVVKSFAAGNRSEMHEYILRGCRIAFVLVSVIVIPLIIETPEVMSIWLREVPEYAIIFVRLVLLVTLVDSTSDLLTASIGATGRIKWYNIVITAIGLLHVVLTYILYYLGYPPYSAMYVYIGVVFVMSVGRFWFNVRGVGLPVRGILMQYVVRGGGFFVLAVLLSWCLHLWLSDGRILCTLLVCVFSVVCTLILASLLVLLPTERRAIVRLVHTKVLKK